MTTLKDAPTDYRSAKTGQYVKKSYADHHPATTIAEHNRLIPIKPGEKK